MKSKIPKTSIDLAKISFYNALHQLLKDPIFDENLASHILKMRQDLDEEISLKLSIQILVLAHHEKHSRGDREVSLNFPEVTFIDLAPHLRNPSALRALDAMFELFDAKDGLYASPTNVKPLSKRADGPVVITLVANSYSKFKESFESELNVSLWQDPKGVTAC